VQETKKARYHLNYSYYINILYFNLLCWYRSIYTKICKEILKNVSTVPWLYMTKVHQKCVLLGKSMQVIITAFPALSRFCVISWLILYRSFRCDSCVAQIKQSCNGIFLCKKTQWKAYWLQIKHTVLFIL